MRYTGIRVTDLDRSLKFYRDGLGLIERRRGRMHHRGVWVLLEDGRSGQRLELNWYPPGSPFATPYVPGEGLDHIGYSTSHAAAVIRKLVARGGRLVLRPTDPGGSRGTTYVADPDGNWVEIMG